MAKSIKDPKKQSKRKNVDRILTSGMFTKIDDKCKICGRNLFILEWNEDLDVVVCDNATGCPNFRVPVKNISKSKRGEEKIAQAEADKKLMYERKQGISNGKEEKHGSNDSEEQSFEVRLQRLRENIHTKG